MKGFAPKRRALSREVQPGALRARLQRSSTWRLRVHAARCASQLRCSKHGTWVEGAGGAAGEADLASSETRAAYLTPGTRQRSDASSRSLDQEAPRGKARLGRKAAKAYSTLASSCAWR